MRTLKLFSVDDHIIEPAHVWSERVPARMRARAPHVVQDGDMEFWEYEDSRAATMGLNAVAGQDHREISPDPVRFSDMLLGAYDPAQRADDMLRDGVLASTFLPAVWKQLPDPADFLAQLKRKAGLPLDHWSPTLRFQRYGAEEIG